LIYHHHYEIMNEYSNLPRFNRTHYRIEGS
jgi:hypothetical protein